MEAKFKIGDIVRTQETHDGPRSRPVYGEVCKVRSIDGTYQYLVNNQRWYWERFTRLVPQDGAK